MTLYLLIFIWNKHNFLKQLICRQAATSAHIKDVLVFIYFSKVIKYLQSNNDTNVVYILKYSNYLIVININGKKISKKMQKNKRNFCLKYIFVEIGGAILISDSMFIVWF